jgi:hypothetical protein
LVKVDLFFLAFNDSFVFVNFNHVTLDGEVVETAVFDHFEGDFSYTTIVLALLSLNLSDIVEDLDDLPGAGQNSKGPRKYSPEKSPEAARQTFFWRCHDESLAKKRAFCFCALVIFLLSIDRRAPMAELVDAVDSKSTDR